MEGATVATRAKLSDVARAAGVSPATASRVLNDNAHVAQDLVDRVLRAKEQLGYRHNSLARGLRTRANNVVGVVIPDVTNPFFTDLVRGIEDVVSQNEYLLVLCNTDETADKESAYLEMLIDQQVAGLVIAPVQSRADSIVGAHKAGIPTVLVDRRIREIDVDSVTIDNISGAVAITARLLEETANVATVTGPLVTTTAAERLTGYRRALQSAGVEFRPEYFIESDYSEHGGHAAGRRLLALDRPPGAIFCGNNAMALGVLRALSEAGKSGAVRVASFDPLPWSTDPERAVLSLTVPTYELGTVAARLLLERIRGFDGDKRDVVIAAGAVRQTN
jgi:LacI family transcriptional regulator